jgi:hypothetical protein
MLEPGTFRGARGWVKYAYHVAAEVTGFSIALDKKTRGGTLQGTVATSNPHLLTQTPLVFVMPTKVPMRWPIESLTVTDGRITACLGALLERE